ncbi:MAG: MOSC domain-containing protein [uncultured Sulfurovum sp.]|uniref:MOSC domain-containing protein n=1 Tax=uncultured Sulfurovum sp. TaxID=269237 RepID=A0A6S6U262_9BACT|nr:MAG: MOSC domain-containing protein [uncultured Sulfurovum sp.]
MSESVGQVVELFVSQRGKSTRFNRTILELDRDGVIDDKFYAKSLERSVLLTSLDSYELALKNGIEMSYGVLGENILIDYNPYELSVGSRLKLGEVTVEITQNCTICEHLSSIDQTLPSLLKEDRGIFVKVVEAGFIEKEAKIYLL